MIACSECLYQDLKPDITDYRLAFGSKSRPDQSKKWSYPVPPVKSTNLDIWRLIWAIRLPSKLDCKRLWGVKVFSYSCLFILASIGTYVAYIS